MEKKELQKLPGLDRGAAAHMGATVDEISIEDVLVARGRHAGVIQYEEEVPQLAVQVAHHRQAVAGPHRHMRGVGQLRKKVRVKIQLNTELQ